MPARKNGALNSDRTPRTEGTWVVSHNKRFRANIIVWDFSRDLSTLEIRAKLSDLGLSSFAAGKVAWEGDHVRLVLTPKDSKGLTKELVSQVSAQLRKIGCRCVLDEALQDHSRRAKPVRVECVNRFDQLDQAGSLCSDKHMDSVDVNVDVNVLSNRIKAVLESKRERRLRGATWNFSGLCSERKQKEVGEVLANNNIDIVAGQESWEKEDSRISVEGYKWFGKPRRNQNSQRGEGGVGF